MRRAKDDVYVVAARHGIDTREITIEFDLECGPGLQEIHTLTIAVRNSAVAATAHDIPHEWLPVSTGFVDTRFSRIVSALLIELHKKAKDAGLIL